MYNYMNAAYLAKLTYEISLSCPSFKNLSLCACAHVRRVQTSPIQKSTRPIQQLTKASAIVSLL